MDLGPLRRHRRLLPLDNHHSLPALSPRTLLRLDKHSLIPPSLSHRPRRLLVSRRLVSPVNPPARLVKPVSQLARSDGPVNLQAVLANLVNPQARSNTQVSLKMRLVNPVSLPIHLLNPVNPQPHLANPVNNQARALSAQGYSVALLLERQQSSESPRRPSPTHLESNLHLKLSGQARVPLAPMQEALSPTRLASKLPVRCLMKQIWAILLRRHSHPLATILSPNLQLVLRRLPHPLNLQLSKARLLLQSHPLHVRRVRRQAKYHLCTPRLFPTSLRSSILEVN